jgi:hypothetical protein
MQLFRKTIPANEFYLYVLSILHVSVHEKKSKSL